MASNDKVKVAVRVRPFNRREIELGTKCVVDMDEAQTVLYHPSTGMKDSEGGGSKKPPKTFAFDHCFWSIDENERKFACQEKVFNCLGRDILERAFEGYNACIFAYGQTGSGKTYTMMGTVDHKGIIPRLCDGLFESIASKEDRDLSFKVEVSYMEIYNEKVRDLLDPKGKHNLRVREHNILGPYVDGLSTLAVSSFEDIENLMSEGNKARTVAATNMNSESSRSHAVFNIIVTQTLTDLQSGVSGEKVSKMSLVDLAGSERAQKTGAVGERLKEGSNINKSLTTLGLVISALADQSSGKSKGKFVPYRDSVLTWLLKDNLGGNSKTVMVATVSPSADNYEETLSTLRYADRAKRIVNHAVVNEDPNARIIRELREEVDMLQKMLSEAQSMKSDDLQDRLEESEKLMKEMGKTWEEKLKETERIHLERHAALEKMGISVQTSGIKVEQGKYYLVNLNADPSLNELLVYYLKDHTLVGRPDAPRKQDIQLSGLGILPEHTIVDIQDCEVYITPLDEARTCVNGCTITDKTKVKHGDRILWGNNHFFRINCPKANSPSAETPDNIDYDFAQQELMMNQTGCDPIQEAITAIEKQHEEDKQEALEKQRLMYERQMQMLRNQLMSPSTPSAPYPGFSPFFFDPLTKMTPTGSTPHMHPKYQQWAREREQQFKQSLIQLKKEVVKANSLIREANFLAQEMGKQTEFSVTLQIPASNLSPNRKRGAFVSEPAIQVKRKAKGDQIWSMEKLENKVIDMRDMYEERKEKCLPMMVPDDHIIYLDSNGPPVKVDPFFESQENHNLIGVANVFLEALFYDVKLAYQVPIISQQGEVAGRLHIELSRVAGNLADQAGDDVSSDGSIDGVTRNGLADYDEDTCVALGSNIICRVCVKEARGLPPALSNFVFCQYTFWGYPEPIVAPPIVDSDVIQRRRSDGMSFTFDHSKEYTVSVTEEFMEHCTDGALSIEVWGHRSVGFASNGPGWEIDQYQAKSRSIMDRWRELTRKMELWAEIHELSEQGEYVPVEVTPKPDVLTGGVFQLRQGHSRRLMVRVVPVQNSGTLPIICESVTHVSIGCVVARSKLQKGLDSYHEEDLAILRQKWTAALDKRRNYLDDQLQKIMNKEEKTDAGAEREKSLIDQWVGLTEERNVVLVPAAGSGIPGAPADWTPPPGMEQHTSVIFLDLNAEDMSTPSVKEGLQAAGINSILPKEHGAKFYTLPFVKNSEKDVCALVSWDSSIHDSVHLNRVTPANERVYLILKVVVRLSHPASMELVLRKRLCINVYKRQSITDKLKKKISKAVRTSVTGSHYFQDSLVASGVTYEIVSNIPKSSEDLEDLESLAQIAASQNEQDGSDGETYIEKYIRGVSAVESILTLDRLRQDVAIKELLAVRGRPLRKSTSVPNIQNMLSPLKALNDQMRSDSNQDLSFTSDHERFERYGNMPKQMSLDNLRQRATGDVNGKDNSVLPNKPSGPFGLVVASPKSGPSPQPTKFVTPMKTLVEEQHVRETKPLLRRDTEDSDEDEFAKLKLELEAQAGPPPAQAGPPPGTGDQQTVPGDGNKSTEVIPAENGVPAQHDSIDSDEFQDFQEYQDDSKNNAARQEPPQRALLTEDLPHSSTAESLLEVQNKNYTPSMTSSGYGSQAVSTQTLSSEDSASVRSISMDETPDMDRKSDATSKSNSLDKADSEPELAKNKEESDGFELNPSLLSESADVQSSSSCETIGASHGSDKDLCRSRSLIDMEVPSDLGSPLQPTTPLQPRLNNEVEGQLISSGQTADSVGQGVYPGSDGDDHTDINADKIPHAETGQNLIQVSDQVVLNARRLSCEYSKDTLLETQIEEQNVANNASDNVVSNASDNVVSNASDNIVNNANDNVVNNATEQPATVDIYSETAMEELERISDTKHDDLTRPMPLPQVDELHLHQVGHEVDLSVKDNEQVQEPGSELDVNHINVDIESSLIGEKPDLIRELVIDEAKSDMPIVSNKTAKTVRLENSEVVNKTADSGKVKLRRKSSNSEEKVARRRSWNDKSDPRGGSTGQQEKQNVDVKLRRTNMDLHKPGSLKKLRNNENKTKTTPSPVKATYRPLSMPPEMMALDDPEHKDGEEVNGSDNEDSLSLCSFGSRADLHRLGESPVPNWVQVGVPVVVLFSQGASKTGVVQFVGQTEFAAGNWVGVDLDTVDGKNDGSVKGIRYFRCRNRHGIFVRHDKLIMDKKRRATKMGAVPSNLRRSTGNLNPSPQKDSSATPSGRSSFMRPTTSSSAKYHK